MFSPSGYSPHSGHAAALGVSNSLLERSITTDSEVISGSRKDLVTLKAQHSKRFRSKASTYVSRIG